MEIDGIDHLVLTVRDLDRTCEFYARALGIPALTFGNGRRALQVGRQKINLHQAGQEIDPKALTPTPGSGDVCFVTRTPLGRVVEHLHACGVAVLEGPVRRTGALGPIESIYLRDPDGNLIEVARYLEVSASTPVGRARTIHSRPFRPSADTSGT